MNNNLNLKQYSIHELISLFKEIREIGKSEAPAKEVRSNVLNNLFDILIKQYKTESFSYHYDTLWTFLQCEIIHRILYSEKIEIIERNFRQYQ